METVQIQGKYPQHSSETNVQLSPTARRRGMVPVFKRCSEYLFSIGALPVVALVSLVLLIINPFLNPGPLFTRQKQTGPDGRQFLLWKFRTLVPAKNDARAHHARLEEDQTATLGQYMRKTQIDDLPNVFNILAGNVHLVRPRPDAHSPASETLRPVSHQRSPVRSGVAG